ncbi:MAG: Zn-ribbon domain-containing OB-fold protein [Actinomycetota bacterium]
MSDTEFRLIPEVTPETEHFWLGGARGELVFLRCGSCRTFVHPPSPVCPECLSRDLAPEAVSGRGTVATFTVNHQPWNPLVPVPYVIALVEIDEQPDVRLMTNIVGCDPDDVRIGMRVRVTFSEHEDVFVPVFEPEP